MIGMDYQPLEREFFFRDSVTLAKDLLGRLMVRTTEEGITVCRITETEAYAGPDDPACHSYGRRAPDGRTNVMYQPGGAAYIYLIYGMYSCFNVVAGPKDFPEAVLIRSAQPVEGTALMTARRKGAAEKNLLTGPGKLCQAMEITKKLYGVPLWQKGELFLAQGTAVKEEEIAAGPRINVDYAGEAAGWPYRFVIRGSRYLSVPMKEKTAADVSV